VPSERPKAHLPLRGAERRGVRTKHATKKKKGQHLRDGANEGRNSCEERGPLLKHQGARDQYGVLCGGGSTKGYSSGNLKTIVSRKLLLTAWGTQKVLFWRERRTGHRAQVGKSLDSRSNRTRRNLREPAST